jgi:hypothetical protein
MNPLRHIHLRRTHLLLALAAALTGLLAFASAAGADMGVVGAYQFLREPFCNECSEQVQNGPGAFASPTGIGVNANGAGGASAGDLYVADSSEFPGTQGRRIQQFSAAGEFERLWGLDVVAEGPDNADEVQAVRIDATGGAFKLTFGSQTTAAIPFDASAATVQSALNPLGTLTVSVAGGPGGAGGSTPYLVTFTGTSGGADQPLIAADDSSLTGSAGVYTTNPGGVGAEICQPDLGDTCKVGAASSQDDSTQVGGAVGGPSDMAIDQTNGDVYSLALRRVNEFSATGQFLRAFGGDAVRQGPDDSNTDEEKKLVVRAGAGTFTLTPMSCFGPTKETTAPIPFDAAAGTVESALNGLPVISGRGGKVTVTGGPGDPEGTHPYLITFEGTLAGDEVEQLCADSTNLLGGAESNTSATVATVAAGGGAEVCTTFDACKEGADGSAAGYLLNGGAGIAVAPSGSPNAGAVLVAEGSRIQEFTSAGAPIRTFGWDVVKTGPDDSPGGTFEVCQPESGDVCQAGSSGSGLGQFTGVRAVTEDSNGAIYTVDSDCGVSMSCPSRVQKFTPQAAAPGLSPSMFGSDETQSLAVNAGGGQFRLNFGAERDGTKGTGEFTEGSNVITHVSTKTGVFAVGQPIREKGECCVSGLPQQGSPVVITAVGPDTITMSRAADATISRELISDKPYATGNLDFDVPASGGVGPTVSVENALNALPSISGELAAGRGSLTAGSTTITGVTTSSGGFSQGQTITGPGIPPKTTVVSTHFDIPSQTITEISISQAATATAGNVELVSYASDPPGSVHVTGGPGDAGGNSPYLITFDGGPLARTDPAQITASQGATPLSGGSGPGANTAMVSTPTPGGPNGTVAPRRRGIETTNRNDSPIDIAIGPADDVFVAKEYPVSFTTCPDGTASLPENRIQELNSSGTVIETSLPCTNIPTPESETSMSLAVNPDTGEPYLLSPSSSGIGVSSRVSVFGSMGTAPTLALSSPSDVSGTAATISGSINPNGPSASVYPNPSATTYQAEFKPSASSTWQSFGRPSPIGVGGSALPFSVSLSGLAPATEYDARVRVVKPYVSAFAGPVQHFTTLTAPPTVDSFTVVNLAAHSADFKALINPQGTASTYHFEYGLSLAYGQSTPEIEVGSSRGAVPVSVHVEGLEPAGYHFRVVASNSAGSTTSNDQAFSFYPGSCPNAIARQQTGASSLPDCRAYELVSPSDAGSAVLIPGGPSSPEAVSPSRFAFTNFIGSIPDSGNPFGDLGDVYISTRTSSGWRTRYVGIPPTGAEKVGGPPILTGSDGVAGGVMYDDSLSKIIDWRHDGGNGIEASSGGYLWDAEGNALGRLPTNLSSVPGADADLSSGQGFAGDFRPSGDLSHYFFSSGNLAFAPGGLTSGVGSAYDNDLADGTVSIVSRTPAGADIPREPGAKTDGYLELPAASTDGSHVLISSLGTGVCGKSVCSAYPEYCGNSFSGTCHFGGPGHLYMRVGGGPLGVTYDVSDGHVVQFEGMTEDGSEVFFTSAERLTPDDHDTSVDLYMWSEKTDSITRLSKGEAGVAGDTDACDSGGWVSKCGVEVPHTFEPLVNYVQNRWKNVDSPIGLQSGAIYFYSPEQLVTGAGIPGQRNLYVARDGSVQFVATLDPEKPAMRLEASPDGRHAAFLTASKLTSYENAGFEAMYSYDAENGALICVSCRPSGAPPTADAGASWNGLFMADDGRTFFWTEDAVVPADTNGSIDTYEYVDGRPQLISPGAGNNSITGASGGTRFEGLVGVSGDGTDVYFSTFETLVPEDHNGPFLKFYDARTSGGFPAASVPAPCVAADECHGAGTEAPPPPRLTTTAALGGGGNVAHKAGHKAKRRKRHRHRHRHHGANKHRRPRGGK